MLNDKSTENFEKITVKSAQTRSIPVDEQTLFNLTGSELKVYMAIRFESDYSKRFSEVQLSIKYIAEKANVCERKVYQALNQLESVHFLLQRLNYQNYKRGQVNSFLVSRDYGYFKQNEQQFNTPAKNDRGVQSQYTPAKNAVSTAKNAVSTAKNDILIDQEYSQESFQNILLGSLIEPAREKPKKIDKNYEYPETLYQHQATITKQLTNEKNYKAQELSTLTNLTYQDKIREIIETCANDKECQEEFDKKFKTFDYEFRRILEECTSHYTTQNRLFDKYKFLDWIRNTCPQRKKLKTKIEVQKENLFHYGSLSKEQQELIQNRKWETINPDLGQRLSNGQQIEADRLINLLEESSAVIPYEAMSEQEKATMAQMDGNSFRVIVNSVLNKIPKPSENGLIDLPVGGYSKPKKEVKRPSISLADRLKQVNKG